jgi:hypothetical protein
MEAPIAEAARAEALEVFTTIKAMVGPIRVKNRLMTREKRHGRGDSADPTESDSSPVDGGRRKPAGGGVTGPGRGPNRYLTNAGPKSGPILWREAHHSIDVLEHPGDGTPIGTARPVGSTEGGVAIWEILIGQAAVPGRWIVLGREFLPKK